MVIDDKLQAMGAWWQVQHERKVMRTGGSVAGEFNRWSLMLLPYRGAHLLFIFSLAFHPLSANVPVT